MKNETTVAQEIHSRKITKPPTIIYRILANVWKMLFMKKYGVTEKKLLKVIKEKKEEMMRISSENLLELNKLAKKYDGNIVVENCGVISHENMLFDEDEFIEMAENIPNDILIDIGHAFANGWDLNNVIYRLKEKIVSYHLHNNDGFEDCHDSIRKGKIDIDEFFKMYRKFQY